MLGASPAPHKARAVSPPASCAWAPTGDGDNGGVLPCWTAAELGKSFTHAVARSTLPLYSTRAIVRGASAPGAAGATIEAAPSQSRRNASVDVCLPYTRMSLKRKHVLRPHDTDCQPRTGPRGAPTFRPRTGAGRRAGRSCGGNPHGPKSATGARGFPPTTFPAGSAPRPSVHRTAPGTHLSWPLRCGVAGLECLPAGSPRQRGWTRLLGPRRPGCASRLRSGRHSRDASLRWPPALPAAACGTCATARSRRQVSLRRAGGARAVRTRTEGCAGREG
jgi:hypothetical protein